MNLKISLIAALFFLVPIFILAQENANFHFKKLQVIDGLSENAVYCILQDEDGFMWFGTKDGLNRFDGSTFRVYQHSIGQQKSIGNNFIRSIAQKDKNSLYIGTDAGLYVMDKADESFFLLDIKTSDNTVITSAINALLVDSDQNLWIATMSQGIFMYNPRQSKLRRASIHQADLGMNASWAILEDKSGTIWAGTRLGLLRYNAQIDKFETISSLFSKSENSSHEVLSILEDGKGNLWLGTWSNGLRYYNKQTEEYSSYLSESKSNYVTHIRSIFQYREKELLIGSDDGLYLFNLESKISRRIDIPQSKYSLSDQNVYSIAQDKEGGIWIGTYFGGVNYLNTALLSIETYYPDVLPGFLSGKAVSQFCEDNLGNIWIATEDGGLNYFDIKTKHITQPVKTSYHNTHALLLDGDQLWIGTFSRGIDVYNIKSKKTANYRYKSNDVNTINDDCIFSLYKTKSGEIYAGTPVGLNKFDKERKAFVRVKDVTGFVYDIKEDDYGDLWLACYGSGAMKFDSKRKQWIHYNSVKQHGPIANSKLTSIYIDSRKRLIFSSEGKGIFIYSRETDGFKNISEANGLPNSVIYGVLDDAKGNLWLSSNVGIICVNTNQPHIYKLYDIESGLQSNQFNYKSTYKSKDGKFYFGGINGFNSFYPEDIDKAKNQVSPKIAITQLSLLGGSEAQLEKEIQRSLYKNKTIRLGYNTSSFTISFVSLSFVSQSKNEYAYMLVGADKDWTYAGNNKSVTYVNLPPGNYQFKVKASNNDGLWNEDGTMITIEILPPFWLSIPAKILYALLSLTAVYFLIVYSIKNSKIRQQRQLEAFKAEQETKSFKSKIEFFTTIAHEIRTPLSLINGPLEEIVLTGEGSPQLKQNISVIKKNSERLSVLINQLLDFRKMDATQYKLHPERINIKAFVEEMYERFKKSAQAKKLQFDLKVPRDKELFVVSDVDALTKIVGNLLTNALKFAETKITIKLIHSKDAYNITVEDDGIGIPDEYKNLVFDPFFQVQSGKDKMGTGIGLSLVKHLTAVMQAKISVKDSLKGGTVFVFEFADLPLTYLEEQDASDNSLESDIFAISTIDHTEEHILIVDDNPDMTSFIKSCLSGDYQVDTAENAEEAMKLLEERNYNLIISDIMMPGVDGISFVKKIKSDINYSHIPVILLSAKIENSTKAEGLMSGADVFIEKPFSTLYLKAQIASLLKNRKVILEIFNRSPLASYSSLVTNKSDEHFLNKLNEEIEKHISEENFSVESLTDILNISRSNFQRKLKAISGYSPGDYLRNYRLKKACLLLLESDSRINEVAFKVGFNSASYFTKAFYKCYKMSPKEFINHHLKNSKQVG